MSTTPREESRAALGRIRHLLEQERVSEARSMLREALAAQPNDQELLRLRALLAPPKVRRSRINDADRTEDLQWLAANGAQYRGRWVAIRGGKLVADAASLDEVLRSVKALGGTTNPLVDFLD